MNLTATTRQRIGEILVEHDYVTAEQVAEALETQRTHGGKVCEILINLGYLTEQNLVECLDNLGGVPRIDLEHYAIDPAMTAYVPKAFALSHEVMPLDRLGSNLTVAMAVPLDEQTLNDLTALTGCHIRAVLCERGTVRVTILQYYESADSGDGEETNDGAENTPLSAEALRLRGVMRLLERVDSFPLLPDTHAQVLQLLDDEETPIGKLVDIIERDPILVTNLLRIANSVAYASRTELSSVMRALVFLGTRDVRNIVLSSGVFQRLSTEANVDLSGMFTVCFRCALLTKMIFTANRRGDTEDAFTAGLLANLGHIAMHVFRHQRARQIEQMGSESDLSQRALEEDSLGVSASEIGYHLACRWNIPESIADAIRYHDRDEDLVLAGPITVAVALAQHCLGKMAADGEFGDPAADERMWALLSLAGIGPEILNVIEEEFCTSLEYLPT